MDRTGPKPPHLENIIINTLCNEESVTHKDMLEYLKIPMTVIIYQLHGQKQYQIDF